MFRFRFRDMGAIRFGTEESDRMSDSIEGKPIVIVSVKESFGRGVFQKKAGMGMKKKIELVIAGVMMLMTVPFGFCQ